MKESLMKFLRDEDGLTTVEYAVAGSLVAAAVVVAFTDLGQAVGGVINGLVGSLGGGGSGSGSGSGSPSVP